MSSGERKFLAEAQRDAEKFIRHIEQLCQWVCIAGSVRRKKAMVGDIEIVVLPTHKSAFLNHLDTLEYNGQISKAVDAKGRTRWGENLRALMYRGSKIEVYLCDKDNQGYITWLRTGPADGNQFVMTAIKRHKASIRMDSGYVWHVIYEKSHARFNRELGYAKLGKLHVPDEATMFRLLGIGGLYSPEIRTEKLYIRFMSKYVNCPSRGVLVKMYAEKEPEQLRLF